MTGRPDEALSVRHTSRYQYSEPVTASLHRAVLILRATPCQQVRHSRILVEPEARNLVTGPDYFGNNVTRFSIEAPGKALRVDVDSEVVIGDRGSFENAQPLSLDDLRMRIHKSGTPEDLRALEFVFESRYVPQSDSLATYASESFNDTGGVLHGAKTLMHRIHRDFTYDATVTDISTPIEEVLARREGVCQDFAHLMIGCLRSLDVPARYVSGYLVPLPGIVGAQASHAWVSVYLPELGWVDFDPTNDILPSTGHITLGWGRDYADVSPLRGVMLGGGSHSVAVEVQVRRMESG